MDTLEYHNSIWLKLMRLILLTKQQLSPNGWKGSQLFQANHIQFLNLLKKIANYLNQKTAATMILSALGQPINAKINYCHNVVLSRLNKIVLPTHNASGSMMLVLISLEEGECWPKKLIHQQLIMLPLEKELSWSTYWSYHQLILDQPALMLEDANTKLILQVYQHFWKTQ